MEKAKEFFAAIQNGDAATVKAVLDAEPVLARTKNEQGQSAVLLAIYHGRHEIRDLLLARGVSLELHEAAAAGKLERVKELVDAKPALAKSYSPDGFPVIGLAAFFGQRSVAEYLLERGADLNAAATNGTGYNALTGAVTGGHKEIVAWLLAKGANANYRYGPSFSPLLAAAANGHLDIVKILLEHSADLRAQSNEGKNALTYATERGHTAVAEYLRSRGL
ncbi:MAG: hypothetical protein AUI53_03865 [Acidobacteria bacterium 13_1_40CM_2_60_7]|nr:MAG: hypothetical protein AUH88_01820 [Acidobacteria bacterium 13_1_40CM_4_61_5]OLD61881.1 MAG: hypothetical protein AUI53_03865 [Acidobacteria bacterium 13_1_40CM_2_60_7]PYU05254.1 MAG: hypothetical protein DMG33_11465 [Acidobacteriota bacterium]